MQEHTLIIRNIMYSYFYIMYSYFYLICVWPCIINVGKVIQKYQLYATITIYWSPSSLQNTIPYAVKISVLRSWRWAKDCPKHVELILEINESLLLHIVGFSILLYLIVYVFLLLRMFCSVYSVSMCRSVYCLCVNVYCTTATGCQPNCS